MGAVLMGLNRYIKKNYSDESFSDMLIRLIRESGYDQVEVYKRAHIDHKLFSKIRCNSGYKPRKKNVIALALALRLDSKTSKTLIKRAGYILTSGIKFDLIIRYCIENKIYDLCEVNQLLEKEGLSLD
jgi:O-acetyl-ADP-ribose deacetylase